MREIVKDAFKVNELSYQFEIDTEDLDFFSNTVIDLDTVNTHYSDRYILNEAKNRLEIVVSNLEDLHYSEPDYKYYKRDEGQLKRFIKKWENKCQPHKNDGLSWEQLKEILNKKENENERI